MAIYFNFNPVFPSLNTTILSPGTASGTFWLMSSKAFDSCYPLFTGFSSCVTIL